MDSWRGEYDTMARKKRVFVVEDHLSTANALKQYLEVCGYHVEVARDMQSALQLAETSKFDVVVCDLQLPDGTGWDLMEQLSARGPINGVAFSAFDAPADRRRSEEAGFAAHIAKGSGTNLLLSTIQRVIERKAA